MNQLNFFDIIIKEDTNIRTYDVINKNNRYFPRDSFKDIRCNCCHYSIATDNNTNRYECMVCGAINELKQHQKGYWYVESDRPCAAYCEPKCPYCKKGTFRLERDVLNPHLKIRWKYSDEMLIKHILCLKCSKDYYTIRHDTDSWFYLYIDSRLEQFLETENNGQ